MQRTLFSYAVYSVREDLGKLPVPLQNLLKDQIVARAEKSQGRGLLRFPGLRRDLKAQMVVGPQGFPGPVPVLQLLLRAACPSILGPLGFRRLSTAPLVMVKCCVT